MKYAPFGTLLQKSTYYVIVCFDKHCTDVSRQIVSYLYKCTYVHIYRAFFIQWLDLGPLYQICQVKVVQPIFQTAQLWFLCIVNLVWKNVFNLDKSISVAHRSNCIEKSQQSRLVVQLIGNHRKKINKMDTQYICIKCILYICYRCLSNFMMILQEMSYDNLVLICIFCNHLTKIWNGNHYRAE